MIPPDWLNNDWQQDNARADVLLECRRDVKTKTLIVLSSDMPSQTVADTSRAPANCFGESFQISRAPICKFCNESRAILPTRAMSSGCYLTTMDRIGKYFEFNYCRKMFVSDMVRRVFLEVPHLIYWLAEFFSPCVTRSKYSRSHETLLELQRHSLFKNNCQRLAIAIRQKDWKNRNICWYFSKFKSPKIRTQVENIFANCIQPRRLQFFRLKIFEIQIQILDFLMGEIWYIS